MKRPRGEVDDFMAKLDHPLKAGVELVRKVLLGADRRVREEVKWNAPSFRLEGAADCFATANVHQNRQEAVVLLVFHRGVKAVKATKGAAAPTIRDPEKLLEWRGKERAIARFADVKSIQARRAELAEIARQWIAGMPGSDR